MQRNVSRPGSNRLRAGRRWQRGRRSNHRRLLTTALASLALGAAQAQPGAVHSPTPGAAAMTAAYVCWQDLAAALTAASPELALRSAEVARRQSELHLAELGLSSMVSLSTGVELGANLRRQEEPGLSPTLQMDAGLSYRHDAAAIARARSALVTAQRREAAQKRADVQNALINLSRLRAAQRLTARTSATALEAEALAASVRQSAVVAHASTGIDWEAAAPDVALDVRELDLAAARARATATGRADEAATAQLELARLGVVLPTSGGDALTSGPVACLPLAPGPLERASGPQLPTPAPFDSPARRLLQLAVDLSAAQSLRAELAPIRDLNISAHYQEGGAQVRAALELDGGRPAAGVSVRWRESTAHAWGVGVAATFRLDDTMGAALASAQAQHEAALAELHAFDQGFPERLAAEVAAVETAWLDLLFALEAVRIAQGRAALATTERDVTRTKQVLERAEDALEREYQSYLRALGRYLAEFDLDWNQLHTAE